MASSGAGLRDPILRAAVGLIAALLALSWGSTAAAGHYDPVLTQYAHTSWRVGDGAIDGAPESITQTRDGYIWIGTDAGLERYDGAHIEHWPLPNDEPVHHVFGARDGSLWVGQSGGVVHIRGGVALATIAGAGHFNDIHEDARGTIWLARTRGPAGGGGLCAVQGTSMRCFGPADHQPCQYGDVIRQDIAGALWLGGPDGACRWRPGAGARVGQGTGLPDLTGVQALLAEPDGSMLVGFIRTGPHLGLERMTAQGSRPFVAGSLDGTTLNVGALLRDRQGALWIGTDNAGIYRVSQGRVDHITSADGLSSNTVNGLLEDREGSIWVATAEGVDQFHPHPVWSFTTHEGLSVDEVASVLPRRDGSIWLSTSDGVDILRNRTVSHIGQKQGLPGRLITSMMEDRAGQLWVGVDDQLARYDGHAFHVVAKPDGTHIGVVIGLAEDAVHDIWALTAGRPYRLYRLRNGRTWSEIQMLADRKPQLIAATCDGTIWILYNAPAQIVTFRGDRSSSIAAPPGTTIYRALTILSNGDAVLSSRRGAYYRRDGAWTLLDTSRGLPCDDIKAAVETHQGALWLRGQCGMMVLAKTDLDRALQHRHEPIRFRLLDGEDGALPGDPPFTPSVAASPDGKLWFATSTVLLMADPADLPINPLPPAVHIEQVIADHHAYAPAAAISLAPRTRDVEIDYAALSFVAPQKVRFRYRLVGIDDDWQDVGIRRAAFYMNLKPGHYRFQVIASNNDGVWNTTGASLDLTIRPAFDQTWWFRVAVAVALIGLLWFTQSLRIRYATAKIEARLSGRQAERIRIARELHDTLLQGFQGLLIRFQVVADTLPDRPATRQMMEAALDRAEAVLIEGRERLGDLRSTEEGETTLLDELAAVTRALERDGCTRIDLQCFGAPLPLRRDIQSEIVAIASEALTNACRHAHATAIFCHVTFTGGRLRMVCGDNGVGIGAETIKTGRKEGHWGLTGMRERARHVGGVMNIASGPGKTRVELRMNTRAAHIRQLAQRVARWGASGPGV